MSRFWGKINESFCLENASKLTYEFLYDIFNKKIYQKTHVLISRQNGSIFFLKIVALRSESVKYKDNCAYSWYIYYNVTMVVLSNNIYNYMVFELC